MSPRSLLPTCGANYRATSELLRSGCGAPAVASEDGLNSTRPRRWGMIASTQRVCVAPWCQLNIAHEQDCCFLSFRVGATRFRLDETLPPNDHARTDLRKAGSNHDGGGRGRSRSLFHPNGTVVS